MTGKVLIRRNAIQIPWHMDNKLIQRVEAWGKLGATIITRNSIDFLNRKGERFDWENDSLLDIQVVQEQSNLIDPGLAEITDDDKSIEGV